MYLKTREKSAEVSPCPAKERNSRTNRCGCYDVIENVIQIFRENASRNNSFSACKRARHECDASSSKRKVL